MNYILLAGSGVPEGWSGAGIGEVVADSGTKKARVGEGLNTKNTAVEFGQDEYSVEEGTDGGHKKNDGNGSYETKDDCGWFCNLI